MIWLDRLLSRLPAVVAARADTQRALLGQDEVYRIAFAQGEIAGRAQMLLTVEQVVFNRRGIEVSQDDVDSVRKAGFH